ncbi:MAG: chorismate-binding protein, partial [Planctomycetes bacterium]|nr:chorismate-binding protein [Planctomycetota bacterium]
MKHTPDFNTFSELAKSGKMVPVYRQLVSDTLTPVTAYCRSQWGSCSFLFESVVGGERIGRYSFLGSDPFLQLEAYGNEVVLTQNDRKKRFQAENPFDELKNLLEEYQAVHLSGLPRFCGGAVGYAGYDVIRYTEDLPNAPQDDRQLPDLWFGFFNRMVIFDHINKTVLVVAHARTNQHMLAEYGLTLKEEYDRACGRVDEITHQLQRESDDLQLTDITVSGETDENWESNFSSEEFESCVEQCKEYIRAGDVFQVVISQRLQRETQAGPLDIYRALRVVNPSPFMFLLRTPQSDLIGSSPEILVRVEDGKITIRPLAGTRKRGQTEAEDQRLAEELLADPKERAEHVMLIDLARNDVGRVAQYGTVELSDVMVVERYSHVMHITSNVSGKLVEGKSALEALQAGLPAGTVSGAP